MSLRSKSISRALCLLDVFVGVKVTRACGFESCPTILGVLGQEEKMAREQANCC